MSFEGFLLFAFFILLPLIERLIRSARQRQAGTPAPSTTRPVRTAPPAPRPPVAESSPPMASLPDIPPVPVSARENASIEDAPVRPIAREPRRKAPIAPRAPLRGLDRLFGKPRDLRRAVVLMTILGPCRALENAEPPASHGAPSLR